jgi:hypothetical protein
MTSQDLPQPPALHWTLVLLLTIVTAGLFVDVWIIVQALWARKVNPESSALAVYIAGIVTSLMAAVLNGLHASAGIGGVLFVAALVSVTVASFMVRDTLGGYITMTTGRPTYLSGVMTILFGPIYFQYHMNKVRSYQSRRAQAAAH